MPSRVAARSPPFIHLASARIASGWSPCGSYGAAISKPEPITRETDRMARCSAARFLAGPALAEEVLRSLAPPVAPGLDALRTVAVPRRGIKGDRLAGEPAQRDQRGFA